MRKNRAMLLLIIGIFSYLSVLCNISVLNHSTDSNVSNQKISIDLLYKIEDKINLFAERIFPSEQKKTVKAAPQQSRVSDEQLMARAINGEARGEPYIGKVAVGAVIINRTKDSRFPKTIAGVIYQPGAFTAVSDGQINLPIDPKSDVLKAARDALNGWDPTDGCVYYFNPATATSKWIWSRTIVKKIGKHNFAK